MPVRVPFFTIGHSTRTIGQFASLIGASAVERVVDVRSIPNSRRNPQFNRDSLPAALATYQIDYRHIAELGGRRGPQVLAEGSPNGLWVNRSFRNYADYALTEPFRRGLEQLRGLGQRRCAIMCAEAVWWRCHRRIIADYLLANGEAVFHILDTDHVDAAQLTPGAQVRPDGTVIYPADRVDGR